MVNDNPPKNKNVFFAHRNVNSDILIRLLFWALIVIVPLIFLPNVTQNAFLIKSVILKTLVGIILIIMLYKTNFEKNFNWPSTKIDLPLLAIFLVALISVIYSMIIHFDQRESIFLLAQDNITFLVINCIFIFYITVYILKKNEYIKYTVYLFFIIASLASFYGILQYWGIEPIWMMKVNPFGGRCISTFGNPNFLASFLVLLIPIGLMEIIVHRYKKSTLFFFITTSGMIIALIGTSTRSAWIGFIFSLLILIIAFIKYKPSGWVKRLLILFFIIGIISSVVVFTAPGRKVIQERAETIFNVENSGSAGSQRLLIWRSAIDIFLDYPVLGTGWGTFEIFYPWYQGKYLSEKKYEPLKTHAIHTHNQILQTLSEIGVLGLGACIWLLVSIILYSIKIMKNLKDSYQTLLVISLLAGVLGMLIDNMLNVTLYFPVPAMLFWINVGMIFAIGNINTESYHKQYEKKYTLLKATSSLIFTFLILIVIYTNINKFTAATIFFNAFTYARVDNSMIDKAIVEYERSLILDPNNDEAYYELGNIYAKKQNLGKARQLYEKSIQIKPGYEEVYYNAGVMNLYLGDEKQAIYNFNKVIKLNPNHLDAYINLGSIYISLKNWEKAKQAYERIISLSPDLVKAHLHLGNIYFALGLNEEAIKEYEKVIVLEPKNPSGYNNRGLVYLKQGKTELAKKDFQTVLRINPYNMDVKKRLELLP